MAVAGRAAKVRLPPMPTIGDLVRMYKIQARKKLSQNFLFDERLTDKIVRAAGHIEDNAVCEVGPGPGGITRSIIRRGVRRVVVVEKDKRFLPSLELLQDACRPATEMEIIVGDILKTDLTKLFPAECRREWTDKPPPVNLIGNLPFSVSTILLVRWLEMISRHEGAWALGRARMTLTFQKEVAERMAASVLSGPRCRLSVVCQNYCKVDYKFDIPGRAFVPQPEVDVAVVTLTPLKAPIIKLPFKMIEKVVRQIFLMRQKYSIRGAQTLFPPATSEALARRMYQLAGVDPVTRPFQLSNFEFCRLCHAYDQIVREHPEVADYDLRAPKSKSPPQVDHEEL